MGSIGLLATVCLMASLSAQDTELTVIDGESMVLKTASTHSFGSITFSPDGALLVANQHSLGGTIYVWEFGSGKQKHVFHRRAGIFLCLGISRDGKTLYGLGRESFGRYKAFVQPWDLETGKELARVWLLEDGAMSITGDGSLLLHVPSDPKRPRGRSTFAQAREVFGKRSETFHEEAVVTNVVASPDNKLIATATSEGHIKLWDFASGVQRWGDRRGYEVRSLSFSPDGKTLIATGARPPRIEFFDVASGKSKGFAAEVRAPSVQMSPDGQYLAFDFRGIILWDIRNKTSAALLKPAGTDRAGDVLAFSPDGRFVAAAAGGQVRVWSVPKLAR